MAMSILPGMGGASGSKILVTAPAGSEVTLLGPGGRVRTGRKKDGIWSFEDCGAGTWTVTAVLGEMTASQVLEITEEDQRMEYHILVTGTFQTILRDPFGLNFSLVGGLTRPDNVPENTIWVKTAQEITGWYFAESSPSAPEEHGTVWVGLSAYSRIGFNALKENRLMVYLSGIAQQYADNGMGLEGSGEWSRLLPVEIFQNGQWVTPVEPTFLYDSGDLCTAVTGGWRGYSYRWTDLAGSATLYASQPTVTQDGQSCTLTHDPGSQAGYRCGSFFGENLILKGGSALHIRVNSLTKAETSRVVLGVSVKKGDNFSSLNYVELSDAGEYQLDLQRMPESFYVYLGIMTDNLGGMSTSVTFDRIWMV